jgi:hypothetical protein
VLIPGLVMSTTRPWIADAYNGYLEESLDLSFSGWDDAPTMAMAPFPGQAPSSGSLEICLVSLRL